MSGSVVLRSIPIPIRIIFSLVSLAGISTAYISGFVSQLGFAFSGLIDSNFIAGAIQVAVLFSAYAFASYRFYVMMFQAGFNHGISEGRRSVEIEIEEFKTKYGDNWSSKYFSDNIVDSFKTRYIKLAKKLIEILFTIISISILNWFIFRSFLDIYAIISFFIISAFWIFGLIVSYNMQRPDGIVGARWTGAHFAESATQIMSINKILSSPILLAMLPIAILLSSYQLGASRFDTLTRANSVCFLMEDYEIEGKLIAEKDDGYFVFFDKESEEIPTETPNIFRIGFIKSDEIISMVPSCGLMKSRSAGG